MVHNTGESPALRTLIQTASQQPDHEVLFDDQRALSLAELVQWMAAIGERIPSGTGPVAVLVDRRVASVAACFGSICGGRGVAPLDAGEPRARLVEYLDRLGTDTVLDATGTVGAEFAGRRVLDVTRVGRSTPSPRPVDLDDAGVVFFTSGSTGRPKAIGRSFAAMSRQYEVWSALNVDEGVESGAVLLPMNFVGGFGPPMHGLTVGRRVYLVDPRVTPTVEIADIVDRAGVRRLTLTPTLIRSLSTSLAGRRLNGVTEVFGVGEPTDWADIELVRGFASPQVVYRTIYGASESDGPINAGMTVGPDVPIGIGRLPLGPMPGPERARLEPVEGTNGVSELIVRGGLISEYWRDPELTAERFGVDPDGVTFWRSRDLVTVDDDGILHLVGRADDMVKVNGQLVEPAEAERVIRTVSGVRDAVVLPRTLRSGRQQLVGHVEADRSVRAALVYQALEQQLPGHVAPGVLVRYDALPMMQRGKVDRLGLRVGHVAPWRDAVPSRRLTAIETSVVEMAAMTLELESVEVDDDLWRIGLDSLAAIELVEAVNAAHRTDLTPNDLIVATTPAALARLITQRHSGRVADELIVHPDGTRVPLHFVCGAGGPSIQYRSLAMALGPDQPFVVFEQRGLHRRGLRDRGISSAARRHVARIDERTPHGPVVVGGHSYGGIVANDMARQLADRGRDVRLILIDPVDRAMVDQRMVRPVNLRQRSGSWVVHGLKLAWWRLHRAKQAWSFPGPPGSERRYLAFYRLGARQTRRHTVVAFAGPTLFVRAGVGGSLGATTPVLWPRMPNGKVVTVATDHNGTIQSPHVGATAELVSRWLGDGDHASTTGSLTPDAHTP